MLLFLKWLHRVKTWLSGLLRYLILLRNHHLMIVGWRRLRLVGLGGRHPHTGQLGLLESHNLLRAHLKHRFSSRSLRSILLQGVFTGTLLRERGRIVVGAPARCRVLIRFMRGIGATCPTTTSSLRRRGWSMGEPGRGDGLVTVGIGATTRCSRVARRRCLLRSGPLVVGLIWGA